MRPTTPEIIDRPAVSTPWREGQGLFVRLVGTMALAFMGVGAALAGIVFLLERPGWWRALAGAAVISLLSGLASLPPLAMGLRRSLQATMLGAMAAMIARTLAAVAGAVIAVKGSHYPAGPTLVLMFVFYVALLSAESYVLATGLWSAKA